MRSKWSKFMAVAVITIAFSATTLFMERDSRASGTYFTYPANIGWGGSYLDKMATYFGRIDDAIGVVTTAVSDLITDLASTANGEGASMIGVEDADSNYAQATVELCFDELADDAFTFQGVKTFSGAVYADGGLDRSAAAALALGGTNANAIDVSTSGVMTTVKGTLNADEAVTLDSTLDVTGAGEFDSTLGADDDFRVGIAGATNFGVTANTGATTIADTLDVTGAVECDDTLGADGDFRVGAAGASNFTVAAATGNAETAGTFTVGDGDLILNATNVTSTAAELNVLDGYTGSGANLNTLTDGSAGDALHTHSTTYYTQALLGSTANGEGASYIAIEDSAGEYAAADVEGALFEVRDEAVQYADLKVVEVVIALGAAAGSSGADATIVGWTITSCVPTQTNDQIIASVTMAGNGAITVTVTANETAEAKFNVFVSDL